MSRLFPGKSQNSSGKAGLVMKPKQKIVFICEKCRWLISPGRELSPSHALFLHRTKDLPTGTSARTSLAVIAASYLSIRVSSTCIPKCLPAFSICASTLSPVLRLVAEMALPSGLTNRIVSAFCNMRLIGWFSAWASMSIIGLAGELRTIIRLESELAELVKELRDNPAPDDAIDRQSTESLGSAADETGDRRQETEDRRQKTGPLILPVKGLNIPFADVALQDGDAVIVERFEPPLVTVMGLVQKPGNFPYPPDARYNLMQAIGFAGGFDQAAEPRYATVYRMKPDSTIVHVIFPLVEGSRMTEALGILIKPGDIVAVEHTPRTRKNVFLDKVFRVNLGVYVPLSDLWSSSSN